MSASIVRAPAYHHVDIPSRLLIGELKGHVVSGVALSILMHWQHLLGYLPRLRYRGVDGTGG